MSVVAGEIIKACNLKFRATDKTRPMIVTAIYRYEPTKVGGKGRHRFAGQDAETGDKMSLYCSKEMAEAASKKLGIKIEGAVAKSKSASTVVRRKTCKAIGEAAEQRCDARRAAKKSDAAAKKKSELISSLSSSKKSVSSSKKKPAPKKRAPKKM